MYLLNLLLKVKLATSKLPFTQLTPRVVIHLLFFKQGHLPKMLSILNLFQLLDPVSVAISRSVMTKNLSLSKPAGLLTKTMLRSKINLFKHSVKISAIWALCSKVTASLVFLLFVTLREPVISQPWKLMQQILLLTLSVGCQCFFWFLYSQFTLLLFFENFRKWTYK